MQFLATPLTHHRSLGELKASFKSLKKTSDESSAFVTQVRSYMVEFNDERKDAVECLKSAFNF